jgi:tetratricopeptide (TPR) repeat protein
VGVVIYSNSFSASFVFDGTTLLRDCPEMTSLAGSLTRSMRPAGMLSFYLNYRLHGWDALWGFHAANLAIHLLAALVLMGIVRRTLSRGRPAERYGPAAGGLALAVAILWMAHPLQTQSVTYLYQRLESLMGLFFLLALYAFIRAQGSRRPRLCYALSVVCWLLALGTKEVAAAAPVVLLWYDRVFVGRSWREIVRQRWGYYGALFAVLAAGVAYGLTKRAWYAGGGILVVKEISPLAYSLSQPGVVLHYLRLSFWPSGQCLDYGWPPAQTVGGILPGLSIIAGLLGLVLWCAYRSPEWGFLGGWFFLILAPTSSFFPIRDLAYEHRMYLSLASVAVLVVLGGYEGLRRLEELLRASPRLRALAAPALVALATIALGAATYCRNFAYADQLTTWYDVVAKAPRNARGHHNLSALLLRAGDFDGVLEHARQAVELNPAFADDWNNLGLALSHFHQPEEARKQFQQALAANPSLAESWLNLGNLDLDRDPQKAMSCYRKALEARPEYAEAHNNLGYALLQRQSLPEAVFHLYRAVELNPGYAVAHYNLADALAAQGRVDEAMQQYQAARQLNDALRRAPESLAKRLDRRGG